MLTCYNELATRAATRKVFSQYLSQTPRLPLT
ncbi:hypothetical protein VPHK165_0050 [Vibrio phage K165]